VTGDQRSMGDQSRRTRVLIVDDDARVRAGLRQMLASTTEFEVAGAAASAPQARAAFATAGRRIDIAIVDVRLPTACVGLDLIRDLATAVPVLALSINGTGRADALAAGAHAYLEKDGAPDALLAALRDARAVSRSS
jgi:DNA-binding NarL/FixJ family response regulator